jgi:hypothetical protein
MSLRLLVKDFVPRHSDLMAVLQQVGLNGFEATMYVHHERVSW